MAYNFGDLVEAHLRTELHLNRMQQALNALYTLIQIEISKIEVQPVSSISDMAVIGNVYRKVMQENPVVTIDSQGCWCVKMPDVKRNV